MSHGDCTGLTFQKDDIQATKKLKNSNLNSSQITDLTQSEIQKGRHYLLRNSWESSSSNLFQYSQLTEMDLLVNGWRRETTESLPIQSVENVVFVPPWGVPSDIPEAEQMKLWKRAICNQHYFLDIDTAIGFIEENFDGLLSKHPPPFITALVFTSKGSKLSFVDRNISIENSVKSHAFNEITSDAKNRGDNYDFQFRSQPNHSKSQSKVVEPRNNNNKYKKMMENRISNLNLYFVKGNSLNSTSNPTVNENKSILAKDSIERIKSNKVNERKFPINSTIPSKSSINTNTITNYSSSSNLNQVSNTSIGGSISENISENISFNRKKSESFISTSTSIVKNTVDHPSSNSISSQNMDIEDDAPNKKRGRLSEEYDKDSSEEDNYNPDSNRKESKNNTSDILALNLHKLNKPIFSDYWEFLQKLGWEEIYSLTLEKKFGFPGFRFTPDGSHHFMNKDYDKLIIGKNMFRDSVDVFEYLEKNKDLYDDLKSRVEQEYGLKTKKKTRRPNRSQLISFQFTSTNLSASTSSSSSQDVISNVKRPIENDRFKDIVHQAEEEEVSTTPSDDNMKMNELKSTQILPVTQSDRSLGINNSNSNSKIIRSRKTLSNRISEYGWNMPEFSNYWPLLQELGWKTVNSYLLKKKLGYLRMYLTPEGCQYFDEKDYDKLVLDKNVFHEPGGILKYLEEKRVDLFHLLKTQVDKQLAQNIKKSRSSSLSSQIPMITSSPKIDSRNQHDDDDHDDDHDHDNDIMHSIDTKSIASIQLNDNSNSQLKSELKSKLELKPKQTNQQKNSGEMISNHLNKHSPDEYCAFLQKNWGWKKISHWILEAKFGFSRLYLSPKAFVYYTDRDYNRLILNKNVFVDSTDVMKFNEKNTKFMTSLNQEMEQDLSTLMRRQRLGINCKFSESQSEENYHATIHQSKTRSKQPKPLITIASKSKQIYPSLVNSSIIDSVNILVTSNSSNSSSDSSYEDSDTDSHSSMIKEDLVKNVKSKSRPPSKITSNADNTHLLSSSSSSPSTTAIVPPNPPNTSNNKSETEDRNETLMIGKHVFVKCLIDRVNYWFEGEIVEVAARNEVKIHFPKSEVYEESIESHVLSKNTLGSSWFFSYHFNKEMAKGSIHQKVYYFDSKPSLVSMQHDSRTLSEGNSSLLEHIQIENIDQDQDTTPFALSKNKPSTDLEIVKPMVPVISTKRKYSEINSTVSDSTESSTMPEIVVDSNSSSSNSSNSNTLEDSDDEVIDNDGDNEEDEEVDEDKDDEELSAEAQKWLPRLNSQSFVKQKSLPRKVLETCKILEKIIEEDDDSIKISNIWNLLQQIGWDHRSSSFVKGTPKYSSCYTAPWTNHLFATEYDYSEKKRKFHRLIEGRDYFFDYVDLKKYLLQFKVYYNHSGITVDTRRKHRAINAVQSQSQSSLHSLSQSRCSSQEITLKLEKNDKLLQYLTDVKFTKIILSWKARGHLFTPESHILINQRIRRFSIPKNISKGQKFVKQYFDGSCISYCPSSTTKEGNIIPIEFAVVYDNSSAFGCGYEFLNLIDLFQALDDFKQGKTQCRLDFIAQRRDYYLGKESDITQDHNKEKNEEKDKSIDSEAIELVKQQYEERIKDAVTKTAATIKLQYEKKIRDLETQHDEVISMLKKSMNNTRSANEIEMQSYDRRHQKEIDRMKLIYHQELRQERLNHSKAVNEVYENLRRQQISFQRKLLKQEDTNATKILSSSSSLSSSLPTSNAIHPNCNSSESSQLSSLTNDKLLKLWKAYKHILLSSISSSKKKLNAENMTSVEEYSYNRFEVSIIRDDDYPMLTTVQKFKNFTFQQQSSLLKVVFKRYEDKGARDRKTINRLMDSMFTSTSTASYDSLSSSSSSSSSINQSRRVEVTDYAVDSGGLLRQWMNDFLEAAKLYVTPINKLIEYHRIKSKSKKSPLSSQDSFRLFSSNGIHYLPTKLNLSTDMSTISLRESISDESKEGDEERIAIRDMYITFGKVLNYLLRDGIPIPSPFASPMLILYLLNGNTKSSNDNSNSSSNNSNNMNSNSTYSYCYLNQYSHQLSYSELLQAIIDIDYDYTGTVQSFRSNNNDQDSSRSISNLSTLYEEFIYPYIIEPREEALIAIKEGFDTIPISTHLQYFTYKQFYSNFVAEDVYDWNDIQNNIIYNFKNSGMETLEEETLFQSIVQSALSQLDSEEIRLLMLLVTGSSLFKKHGVDATKIEIYPKIFYYEPDCDNGSSKSKNKSNTNNNKNQYSRYPKWPLPKSFTCFGSLYIPFFKITSTVAVTRSFSSDNKSSSSPSFPMKSNRFFKSDDDDDDDDVNETSDINVDSEKTVESKNLVSSLWNVSNVLKNIRSALNHSVGDFHDTGISD